jgi:glycogen phosphorylase
MEVLEKVIRPAYYKDQKKWVSMMRNGTADVAPAFDSGRMADEYYKIMYNA